MKKLTPGDRVVFEQNGRKLRGVVADFLPMKARGQEMEIPVVRPRNRKKATANLDRPGAHSSKLKVRWIKRDDLRKLPE